MPFKNRLTLQNPLIYLLLGYLVNGYRVIRGAIDIPLLDEWTAWWSWPANASAEQLFRWIFSRHNEHRIVLTRIEFLFVNALWGGNEVVLVTLNYVFFGLLLILLAREIMRLDPENAVAPFSILFILSSLPYENHIWGFQSQFHFPIIFFLLALPQLFRAEPSKRRAVLGVMLLAVGAFSFSAGLAYLLIFSVLHLCFEFLRRPKNSGLTFAMYAAAMLALVATLVAVWSHGYVHPRYHPPLYYPWQLRFWPFFLTEVAFGFGVGKTSVLWGAVALVLCLGGWLAALVRDPSSYLRWRGMAAAAGILGAMAIVASGRAGFEVWMAKSSRYTEISLLLVPLTAVGLGLFGGQYSRRKKHVFSGALVALLAVTFFHKFSNQPYLDEWARRERGRECLKVYFSRGGEAYCPDIFPAPLDDTLQRIKGYHPSFLRQFDVVK